MNPSGWVEKFEFLKVLVIGDVILDRYWWGDASRLSPEAPVPILLKRKTTMRPGGAANAAANVSALGSTVNLLGLAGQDQEATQLQEALRQERIGTDLMLFSSDRPTTTKTRIIAGHQHIVRVDEEEIAPLSHQLSTEILRRFQTVVAGVDAVLVSDYSKGLLTADLLKGLIQSARDAGTPVFVDPKGTNAQRYLGASILKPNRLELSILVGRTLHNHAETLIAGRELRDLMPGTSLLVTEAADGMTFFGADGHEHHVPSEVREVFDITGAGDTVLASLSLAIVAGAPIPDAMLIASTAAGIAIASMGAATVSSAKLTEALRPLS